MRIGAVNVEVSCRNTEMSSTNAMRRKMIPVTVRKVDTRGFEELRIEERR